MERYVYISYCDIENKIVRDKVIELGRQYRVMVGCANHHLNEETKSAIANASAMVVFLSVHYCDSSYCREVLKYAVDNHKFIMPVLMDYESDFNGEREATFKLCQASMHMVMFDDRP